MWPDPIVNVPNMRVRVVCVEGQEQLSRNLCPAWRTLRRPLRVRYGRCPVVQMRLIFRGSNQTEASTRRIVRGRERTIR